MTHALTTAHRQELAATLQQRRQVLLQDQQARQRGLSQAEQALATREDDGDDARQLASEREVEATLDELETRELAALDNALRRVHEPEYGLCADCGRGIPLQRLQIEPQALRCVACETQHERKEA